MVIPVLVITTYMKYLTPVKYKPRRLFSEEDDVLIRTMRANHKTYDQICAALIPPAARGSVQYRIEVMAKMGLCRKMARRI